MMIVYNHSIIPAQGYPAKYYFAGTPEAGIQSHKRIARRPWAPAFAGAHK